MCGIQPQLYHGASHVDRVSVRKDFEFCRNSTVRFVVTRFRQLHNQT